MKLSIDKINNFISKLLLLLEEELDKLQSKKAKNIVSAQKNIADILNKLVNLIVQLNKLSKENSCDMEIGEMTQTDKEIIERFLAKYSKKE